MSGPYRQSDESPDREGLALIEIGARRTGLRMRVLAVFLTIGLGAGLPGYVIVREAQFAAVGVAWPQISAAVGFLIPVLGAGALGLQIARRLIRARMNAWLPEIAARYRVKRERLEEITALVDAVEGG